jgi:glycosyltransferase involved in cell wall biosynthesis
VKNLSVLNISSGDLVGSRFNGYDWHDDLAQIGIDTKMLVGWNHDSQMKWVQPLANRNPGSIQRNRDRMIYQQSLKSGTETMFYPWSLNVFNHPWYKSADVVHLQIVHDGTLDLRSIGRIIREKPTVWTWHDPWPLTGHCIYPMDCGNWLKGCGNCPDLKRAFSIGRDLTRQNRSEKQELIKGNYVLHVASNWFLDFIKTDPFAQNPKPDLVPFGLNLKWTIPKEKTIARSKLGISPGNFVIGLRSVDEPQKNLELIQSALRQIPIGTPITILTIQNMGRFEEFRNSFEVVELPWSNDNDFLSMFYSSLDLFIMPSLWETFGLMALESMSYGVPVAALSNTATSEVCNIQENGFIIPENNGNSLAGLILSCMSNSVKLQEQSEKSRKYLQENRNYPNFIRSMSQLYFKSMENF